MMISFRKAGATTPALSRDKETDLSKMQASVIKASLLRSQVPDREMKNYFMTLCARCHDADAATAPAGFSSEACCFLLPPQQASVALATVAATAAYRSPATMPPKPVPVRLPAHFPKLAR